MHGISFKIKKKIYVFFVLKKVLCYIELKSKEHLIELSKKESIYFVNEPKPIQYKTKYIEPYSALNRYKNTISTQNLKRTKPTHFFL